MTKGAIIKEMAEYVNEVIMPTKPQTQQNNEK